MTQGNTPSQPTPGRSSPIPAGDDPDAAQPRGGSAHVVVSDDLTPAPDQPAGADLDPFLAEANTTLRELRRATAAVLAACGGLERATDVAIRLDIDRSLAWKIWQVGQGHGPFPSPAHIPGAQGYRRFLVAASIVGVPEPVVALAQAAFDGFARLGRRHAGDRAAVDTMLSGMTTEGRSRLENAMRRDGFRANAHLLGVQAACVWQIDVLCEAGPDHMPEVFRLRAHHSLCRNRPGVPWIVARSALVHETGPSPQGTRTPLALATPTHPGASPIVVEPFCSRPPPMVLRRVIAGTIVEDELQPGAVGQSAAVDVVTAERIHDMPRRPVSSDAVTMSILTPCERVCYEVVASPRVIRDVAMRVHSTLQTDMPFVRGETYAQIPVLESIEPLGPALAAPCVAEVPRQEEIRRWLLSRVASVRPIDDAHIWRVRMRFPPVPSVIAVRYAFADRA